MYIEYFGKKKASYVLVNELLYVMFASDLYSISLSIVLINEDMYPIEYLINDFLKFQSLAINFLSVWLQILDQNNT